MIFTNNYSYISLVKRTAQIIFFLDWVAIATISTQDDIKGFPYVSLKSFSDGTKMNSTGIPFLYMTDMDVIGKDVLVSNK